MADLLALQSVRGMVREGYAVSGGRPTGTRGGHSHRPCTFTRDRGQDVGQVAKVENLSSQRVKANFSWSKWVQRSTSFPLK